MTPTPGATDLRHLWQPLKVGNVTAKNRIVDPPKTLLYGQRNMLSDRHIAFYRERAKGGVAIQISEQTAAHPIAKGSFYQGITAYEKRVIPKYEELANVVHEYDCKFFVQLFTPGVHDKGSTIMDEWHPLWAASRVPSNVHHETPMVMQQVHVDDLVAGFGDSAFNMKFAGIDGVEVHAAHSYGIAQFMSPYYNKRTDGYGLGAKAGCQLTLDIGAAIRRRVGDDFVVGVRMCWDEFLGDAGITPELASEQLEILAASGLFDYFSISGSAYPTLYMGTASMRVPQGYMLSFGKAAKEVVGDRAAVMIVGRIKTLEMANEAVANGSADMVCMSRASLADAFLVKKGQEGRTHEINKCVGINECISRLFEQREVVCALNPVAGREERWGDGTLVPVPPAERKKVVVVGGGLAGMKTAAVAARRGHKVVLLERDDFLGGRIHVYKQLPARGEWDDAINNLRQAMASADVDVQLGAEATPETLQAHQPDVVVWASGAVWDGSGFSPFDPSRAAMPGAEQDNVLDLGTAVERALVDPEALGRRVVLSEETGDYFPLAFAELIAKAGVDVEIVSPNLFIGEDTVRALEMQHIYPALRDAGVRLVAQQLVDFVDGSVVAVKDIWSGDVRHIDDVDTLVLSHMRVPREDGLDAVRDAFGEVVLVGDVVAPRKVSEIMFEGEKVGREL